MAKAKKEFNVSSKLPLHGKHVAFTGKLEGVKRKQASAVAYELGANVDKHVSAKTDFIVVGAAPGSKLLKAQENGVEVLTQKEFFDLVRKQRREEKIAKAIVAKLK
ncbi:MAG: BRCT domain-containing protein [Alphaproteobacteria bacterium]